MHLIQKYAKINRSIPYNKINTDKVKKVNNIKGINEINDSTSFNKDIAKPETDEISAYIISQETIVLSKKEDIDIVNQLQVSVAVKSETENHSEFVNEYETTDDTIEAIKDIICLGNIESSEDLYVEDIKPEIEDNVSNIMAQKSANGIYKSENAMSYESSISPSNNIMKGVDFKMRYEYEDDIVQDEDDIVQDEDDIVQGMPSCTDSNDNCTDCRTIFRSEAKREAFGYPRETVDCECHDICVADVRDISVKERTKIQDIPCRMDGHTGCRGGISPDGPPSVISWRVLHAKESLNTSDCLGIFNEVEFEVVLSYAGTLVVITPKDEFECRFHDFARFPSGVKYKDDHEGREAFLKEISHIDGAAKVIIIESVKVRHEDRSNDCELVIVYKAIDKLWKHENLLVSALKPYVGPGETINFTVNEEFEHGHK